MPVHPRAAERVVLDVVVGHPRRGDGRGDAHALVVRVHRDGKAELVGGRPQRVVHGVAVRDARTPRQEHPDELVATAEPADLVGRCLGVLRGHDEHPAQARLLLQPVLEQPVVVGAAEPCREVRVGEDGERGRLVRLDDPERHLVHVEVALAEQVEGEVCEVRVVRSRALVDVVPEPAGRMVPGIGGHREAVGAGGDDELAGRGVEVRQEIGDGLVADVDVAVDQHAPIMPGVHLVR